MRKIDVRTEQTIMCISEAFIPQIMLSFISGALYVARRYAGIDENR
jgi:hypothetical protein